MNQYQVDAYPPGAHDGRARRRYVNAETPQEAADKFHRQYPNWVARSMWSLVPPGYWEASRGIMQGTQGIETE